MMLTTVDVRGRRTLLASLALVGAATVLASCSGGGSDDGDGADGGTAGGSELTVVGACAQLVGPRASLLDDALGAGDAVTESAGAAPQVDAAAAVEKDLSALLATAPASLQRPGGVIVDYLKDNAAYDTPEGLSETVTDAVTKIDAICAG